MHLPDTLDNNFSKPVEKARYPYIFISLEQLGDELPIMIETLDKGTVPIVIPYENQSIAVADIAMHPLNLMKLLRVYKLVVHMDTETRVRINSVSEMLEAPIWM